MQIAITGHTQAIGQALYQALGQEHTVTGYSRSNGYDLTDPACIEQMIKATADDHVLINNAHAGGQQARIAQAYAEASMGNRRLIINLSSEITRYLDKHSQALTPNVLAYAQAKKQLIAVSNSINQQPAYCRSTVLSLGWVEQGLSQDLQDPLVVQSYDYFQSNHSLITVGEVVDAVKFIIGQSRNIHIMDLTLSNWDIC